MAKTYPAKQKNNGSLHRFLSFLSSKPKLEIPIACGLALLTYLLYALFGWSDIKPLALIMSPILSLLLAAGCFFILFLQKKNPTCPAGLLDILTLIGFLFSLFGTVFSMIEMIIDINRFFLCTPGVFLLFAALVFFQNKWNR